MIGTWPGSAIPEAKFSISAVPGFFKQADPKTNASSFDYAKENFGLIERSYDAPGYHPPTEAATQWERLTHYIHFLRSAGSDYRLLFLGRHGQGWHNVAESYYGTKAWDEYWSKLDGGAVEDHKYVTWADAHLTAVGIKQAQEVNAFWKKGLGVAKIPAPQSYYVSPMYRCLQTAHYTFDGLTLPPGNPFVPLVKELLRETMGEHTCDRRSSKAYIHAEFPDYPIESGFSEDDQMWRADHRETPTEQFARLQRLLEDVFEHDTSPFISLTSHSGSIAAILAAVGHRTFALPTGGVIPVIVKVSKVST